MFGWLRRKSRTTPRSPVVRPPWGAVHQAMPTYLIDEAYMVAAPELTRSGTAPAEPTSLDRGTDPNTGQPPKSAI